LYRHHAISFWGYFTMGLSLLKYIYRLFQPTFDVILN